MFDDHEDGAFMPKFPCPEGWDETSLFLKKSRKVWRSVTTATRRSTY